MSQSGLVPMWGNPYCAFSIQNYLVVHLYTKGRRTRYFVPIDINFLEKLREEILEAFILDRQERQQLISTRHYPYLRDIVRIIDSRLNYSSVLASQYSLPNDVSEQLVQELRELYRIHATRSQATYDPERLIQLMANQEYQRYPAEKQQEVFLHFLQKLASLFMPAPIVQAALVQGLLPQIDDVVEVFQEYLREQNVEKFSQLPFEIQAAIMERLAALFAEAANAKPRTLPALRHPVQEDFYGGDATDYLDVEELVLFRIQITVGNRTIGVQGFIAFLGS